MKYQATRSNEVVDAAYAILNSFDEAGGLFFPEHIPTINLKELQNKNYQEIAYEVLKEYFAIFDQAELKEVINLAYAKNNFMEKIVDLKHFDKYCYLELFHGQTLAFKDMALSLYPYLLQLAKKQLKLNEKLYILTATSGDTGKAALEAIKDLADIKIAVLYPNEGVSKIQAEQMQKQEGNNVEVIAIEGDFDDAQNCVKDIFNDKDINHNFNKLGYHLISANSINIARLLPQVVYYVYAYFELVEANKIKMGEEIDVYVPTGNFGNILAGYIAKEMGVPIAKLVCVSNENNILFEFFTSGNYDISNKSLHKTFAPSMDILISSNLERYLYLKLGNERTKELMLQIKHNKVFKVSDEELNLLQEDIKVACGNDQDILTMIKDEYQKQDYLLDPHTALARHSLASNNYSLIIATASPFKFVDVIKQAFEDEEGWYKKVNDYLENNQPIKIKELENRAIRFNKAMNDYEVADYLLAKIDNFEDHSFEVIIPGTTANIGAGFDTTGIALSIYNKFTFDFNSALEIDGNYKDYNNDDNMVYQTYLKIMKKYHKEVDKKFHLKIEGDVPISRGLGSSSTCIVAGVIAANIIGKLNLSKVDIAYEGSLIEGHPDNVIPAVLGGMVSGVIANETVYYHCIKVSDKLKFYALIGQQELQTSLARAALPDNLDYPKTIYNISRASICLNAFEKGLVKHLPIVTDDRIHQSYRMALMNNIDEINKIIDSKQFITHWISGAGTTMMFLGHEDKQRFIDKYNEKEQVGLTRLDVDYQGTVVNYK